MLLTLQHTFDRLASMTTNRTLGIFLMLVSIQAGK